MPCLRRPFLSQGYKHILMLPSNTSGIYYLISKSFIYLQIILTKGHGETTFFTTLQAHEQIFIEYLFYSLHNFVIWL